MRSSPKCSEIRPATALASVGIRRSNQEFAKGHPSASALILGRSGNQDVFKVGDFIAIEKAPDVFLRDDARIVGM